MRSGYFTCESLQDQRFDNDSVGGLFVPPAMQVFLRLTIDHVAEVPYVNTWFWPSFTLVGTSSLFFGASAKPGQRVPALLMAFQAVKQKEPTKQPSLPYHFLPIFVATRSIVRSFEFSQQRW